MKSKIDVRGVDQDLPEISVNEIMESEVLTDNPIIGEDGAVVGASLDGPFRKKTINFEERDN